MRPLGGALADRIGGVRALLVVYTCSSLLIALAGFNARGAADTRLRTTGLNALDVAVAPFQHIFQLQVLDGRNNFV